MVFLTGKGGQPNLSSPPRCILQRLIEGLSKTQALQGRKAHLFCHRSGPFCLNGRGNRLWTPVESENWIRIHEGSGLKCSKWWSWSDKILQQHSDLGDFEMQLGRIPAKKNNEYGVIYLRQESIGFRSYSIYHSPQNMTNYCHLNKLWIPIARILV